MLIEAKSFNKKFELSPVGTTSAHLCCWEIRITAACLAVAFENNITAKLLQFIRITNADGRYSSAPIVQMQC